MARRETLKRGLTAATVLALVPEWVWPALYRLRLTELVKKPIELAVADLKAMKVGGYRQRLRMFRPKRTLPAH